MQKLKKVFSPGNDKDDEQMYGSFAARKAAGAADQSTPGTSTGETAPSKSVDSGVSRQILNPGGDKYDEQRFGEPASAQSQLGHTAADRDAALESRMGDAKEDRSVKREVLNPDKSGRDETGYGATAFKGRDTAADQSGLSSSRPAPQDTQSGLSMKSGVIGSPDQSTEERALYSDGIASQDTTTDSNFGRNTALAGAGAAAGAGGAYTATRSGQDAQKPTHTDRSFPLRGGAVAGQEDSRPTSSVYSAEGAGPTSSSGATGSSAVTGLYRGTAGGTGADSGKAALTNLGLAQHYDTDHKGHSHAFQGDPCETSPTIEKTLSNIPGPHVTVAANMLDPHVPGEFPTEDGTDPHGRHGATGFGDAAQQPSSRNTSGPAVGSEPDYGAGVQPERSTDDHHYGRNAALAGGAGAAGLGAYAATRDRSGQDEPLATQSSSTTGPITQQRDSSLPIAEQFTSRHGNEDPARTPQAASDPISSSSEKDHHYGRKAALAAGAGAAGYGAYQYSNRDNNDPTSKSTDPYDTYKDATDSRVQPETTSRTGGVTSSQGVTPNAASATSTTGPATDPTSSNTTAGPHSSDLANKADPRVQSDPYATQQQQPLDQDKDHHYGRNAALAGGVGAAGYGAYQYSKDRGDVDPTSSRVSEPSAASYSRTQPEITSTTGPHGSDTLNKLDPRVQSDSQRGQHQQPPLDQDKEHHYGRNAALAGGAGAAGYGAYQYSKDRGDTDPTSARASERSTVAYSQTQPGTAVTTGPHASDTLNKADPRVQSDSQYAQQQQPLDQDKEHHYGRNAALAGGAGAAGYGAYQYSKDRGEIDPASTLASQPSTGAVNTYTEPQTTSRTAAPTSSAPHHSESLNKVGPRVDADPYASQQQQKLVDDDKDHHYGRNAALAGGAGAAGAAGYSALQNDREDTGPASKTIGPHKSNVANIVDPRVQPEPEKMKEHTTAGPWQSDTLNKMDPKVESDPNKADVKAHGYASGVPTQPQQQQPTDEGKDHHYGRNAAVAGGAGAAGAAAYGAYDQQEQEKLAKGQAKEQEKFAKEQEKQAQHDAKEQAKEQEKQAKHDAKEQDKKAKHDAHEAEKARKKEEERQAKEKEKLDKQHAKEQEKAEEKRLKEQEKAEEKRLKEQEKLEKEKEKENAKLAAARQDEAEGKHHNKLHKDPPEEREKKDGIFHRIFHHKHHEREGVEGTREGGSSEEGERSTGAVGEGAFNNEGGPESSSSFGNQNLGQSVVSGTDDSIVTNPTTGLPENVGKYGSGAGGTDGSDNITGYHAR